MKHCVLWCLLSLTPLAAQAADLDRDGLDDQLEQQLLERFQPTLLIDQQDCDVAPARFAPEEAAPRALASDGTIYGQAFPSRVIEGAVELHYHLLWAHDCGATPHALDPEHVSALILNPRGSHRASDWSARYWYAAAHESTVCDSSHAARADRLNAESHGPRVWISQGKHASYLDPALCPHGCGADRCSLTKTMKPSAIVNLGELFASLNGASWSHSNLWSLEEKLDADFAPSVLLKIDQAGDAKIVELTHVPIGVRSAIQTSGSTADAILIGAARVDAALSEAFYQSNGQSTHALEDAAAGVGQALVATNESLKRPYRSVTRWWRRHFSE